jgi:hypothetical protein
MYKGILLSYCFTIHSYHYRFLNLYLYYKEGVVLVQLSPKNHGKLSLPSLPFVP